MNHFRILITENENTLLFIAPTFNPINVLHFHRTVYCEWGDQFGGGLESGGSIREFINDNIMCSYLATIIIYIILGIYLKCNPA
jgi:hypothetical protein